MSELTGLPDPTTRSSTSSGLRTAYNNLSSISDQDQSLHSEREPTVLLDQSFMTGSYTRQASHNENFSQSEQAVLPHPSSMMTSQSGQTSHGDQTSQSGQTSHVDQTSQSGQTSQGDQTSQSGQTSHGDQTSQSGQTSHGDQTSHNDETSLPDPRSMMTSHMEENVSFCPENPVPGKLSSIMLKDNRYSLSETSVPECIASASSQFTLHKDNFLRGCKWSPDGTCVLTNSNDNHLRVFTTCQSSHAHPGGATQLQMTCSQMMKESGQIYDFAWHPCMVTDYPPSCRVAATCSGIPIHMWDSNTGQIVSNYRAYDQNDEITAAYSLTFSPDGSRIFAGYNKAIRIFDVEYPVRSCKLVKTFNRQKKSGQSGIISCFAHSPDGSGMYVAGSYSRQIGVYDSACDRLVCLMQGQRGGITHLMFSPDGTKLLTGGRKDAEILCWDVRNMGKLLFSALRDVRTNQRIYFDLSSCGRYLVSGNHDGTVVFWDMLQPTTQVHGDSFLQPCCQFQAHGDCVNGVSWNPAQDLIATSSGQRHFSSFDTYDSDDGDEAMEEEELLEDFSLKIWRVPLLE